MDTPEEIQQLKDEFKNLLDQRDKLLAIVDDQKQDLDILHCACIDIIKLFGLYDAKTNGIDPGFLDQSKNIWKPVLRVLVDTGADASHFAMKLPGWQKKEKVLADKFAFTKYITPILQKHAGRKYDKPKHLPGPARLG